MYKKMRILLAFLLCAALVTGSTTLVSAVQSDWPSTEENYTWSYDEESATLTISGTGKLPDFAYEGLVPEPDDVEEEDVSIHGTPWIAYRDTARHIVIEEGITRVGLYNFNDFTVLESVTLPTTVVEMGEQPFPRSSEYPLFTVIGTTMTVAELCATEYGYQFSPVNSQLRGDINNNGEYEAVDALSILKMVVEAEAMYGYTADADESGTVDASDALLVLQKVVGLK